MNNNTSQNNLLRLTIDLLKINSWSGNEIEVANYVTKELKKLKFNVKKDKAGNVYAVRGKANKYPLFNAHMDIVDEIDNDLYDEVVKQYDFDSKITKDVTASCKTCINKYDCAELYMDCEDENLKTYTDAFKYVETYGTKCASYDEDYNDYTTSGYYTGYLGYRWNCISELSDVEQEHMNQILTERYEIKYDKLTQRIITNKLRVLGGDDKCGIALILQLAKELPNKPMKVLFTVQEEIGCVGISHFCKTRANWFNNVSYSVTVDRQGDTDLLFASAGKKNCSNMFASLIAKCGLDAGVLVTMNTGTIADIIYIRDYVQETVNISAGYHNPHSTDEYISFKAMKSILNWLKNIVLQM